MRLIHTSKFTLHEFQASTIPYYAILSHTWNLEEVSFHDMQSGRGIKMACFAKIKGCCAQAASEGWEYVWIDSCCIDKSSSAELSEAINSMFQWYQNAQVCYAYLSDVSGEDRSPRSAKSAFMTSRWFTRGWTLQELLAPSRVVFYNHSWIEIGTKSSLHDVISSVTGITRLMQFKDASVAQKMSWASKRETTKEEDMAYCLMGLFDVNMPPLYGEGENAFQRLQLEILSKSEDESIFAWKEIDFDFSVGGLLARSPLAFEDSGDILQVVDGLERPPFSMTNKGLRIELLLLPPSEEYLKAKGGLIESRAMAQINCCRKDSKRYLALCLRSERNRWFRAPNVLSEWTGPMDHKLELVHILQPPKLSKFYLSWEGPHKTLHLLCRCPHLFTWGFQTTDMRVFEHNCGDWKAKDDAIELVFSGYGLHLYSHTIGGLQFYNAKYKESFVLCVDADEQHNVGVDIFLPTSSVRAGYDISTLDFHYKKLLKDKKYAGKDRISTTLESGTVISAVLVKRVIGGEIVHVIDLTCTLP